MAAYTSITDIVGSIDLPNPTTPIPFERFAALGDSDDMLQRAAFWAFYAAWLSEKSAEAPSQQQTAVLARHDGHQLQAICHQLALRDCVMIQQQDLDRLTEGATRSQHLHVTTAIWLAMAIGALVGGFLVYLVMVGR